jgi:hypothetical protein
VPEVVFLRGQRLERQVGIAVDRGEEVVEVVGHAAGELPDRFHLLRLPQLLLERYPFGDVARVRDEERGVSRRVEQG